MKDIFALQDEVTMKILTSLQVKLTEGEQANMFAKGTDNLKAYLKLLEGQTYLNQYNKEGNIRARHMFEEAIVLDPKYALAYGSLATTYAMDYWLGSESPYESNKKARELAEKALALDDSLSATHGLLGYLYFITGYSDKSIAEVERAIALAPNSAAAHVWYGMVVRFLGDAEIAILFIKKGIRLNPIPPGWYFYQFGGAYIQTGRLEEALRALKKSIDLSPSNIFSHMALVYVYDCLNRGEDARKIAAEILRINPGFSIDRDAKAMPWGWTNALRNAGLK